MPQFVTYRRLSRESRNGRNYGMDAQQRDLDVFLSACPYADGCEVIGSFEDTQSGADDDRPGLVAAITLARRERATLLVSRLDRLSRRVSFIAQLLEVKDLEFRVASMPHANKFELHIYAALAEQEREFIAARTKAGLAAARARGVKLGGARPGLEARNAARVAKAVAEAERLRPVLEPLVALGYSLTRIGDELARHGHLTKGGKGIAPSQVRRYLERLGLKQPRHGVAA
jgi:DNA invertase Pin-like site-specific DNA recombinase